MGLLVGLGAFVGCLVAGAILLGLGHWLIGIVLMLASVPCAIVAWIKWNDRSYG